MSEVVRLSLIDAHAPSTGFRAARSGTEPEPERAPEPVSPDGADSYADGFADGQRAASEIFAREHAAMAKLLAATSALQSEPSEELAAMIATAVARLAGDIVGSAAIDGAWLQQRCRAAADLICEADAARTLWLHPDDLPLVEGIDVGLTMMADASLDRGALRIDCSAGWIEDGRSIHLDALRAELGVEGLR